MFPIAITAAPRDEDIQPRCLQSVLDAGFDDIRYCAEPGTVIPTIARQYCIVRTRMYRHGEYHNWLASLRELLVSRPNASAVATFQDDCIFCKHSAEVVESRLWPSERCGALHIYTSKRYASYRGPIAKLQDAHARRMAAACAIVFRREAAEQLIHHADTTGWRGHTGKTITTPSEMEGLDTFIGEALTSLGWEIWVHVPSLGQTIAKGSTLGHGGPFGSRIAACFPGEHIDARQL